MSRLRKPLVLEDVFYQRNVDLGLDPYCHECTSHSHSLYGYTVVNWDGFQRLHRWVYWKETGETPEVVMHLCDNTGCNNIYHLRGGTQADNILDCYSKGRFPPRPDLIERNKSRAFITAAMVREIKKFRSDGWCMKDLVEFFGVSTNTLSLIVNNHIYTHVDEKGLK